MLAAVLGLAGGLSSSAIITAAAARSATHAQPALRTRCPAWGSPAPAVRDADADLREAAPCERSRRQLRWRAAWAATLDDSDANTQWNAHPTPLGSPSAADATYRFIIRPTISGTAVRIRLGNFFDVGLTPTGTHPVRFADVTVGLSRGASGASLRGMPIPVRFAGARSVTLAPGASVTSDPVAIRVSAGRDLAVSVFVPESGPDPPFHQQTFVSQYATPVGFGNQTSELSGRPFSAKQEPIYWLDSVDVLSSATRTIVALGDSITDGDGCGSRSDTGACEYNSDAGMNRYSTYPDDLAERVAADPRAPQTSVINEGANGSNCPQMLARLPNDVLALAGVTDVILEVGTNDLTEGETPAELEQCLTTAATELHRHAITVIAATLVPRAGNALAGSPIADDERAEVNAWIRTDRVFDAVLDIARVVGQPGDDDLYQPRYNSGDGLHPDEAGYRAIADAFDLGVLGSGTNGSSGVPAHARSWPLPDGR